METRATKAVGLSIGIALTLLVALVIGLAGMSASTSAAQPASSPAVVAVFASSQGPSPANAPGISQCGPNWSVVPSPNVGTADNYLSGVAAASNGEVWAVGYVFDGTVYRTLIERWDGSMWSVVPSPNVGNHDNYLDGVAVVGVAANISSNDVWAVGFYYAGVDGLVRRTLTEHWDGATWSVVPSPNVNPTDNALKRVAGVSASDVWAVGYASTSSFSQTLIEHWDGNAWGVVPSPNPGTVANFLNGLAIAGANDIWAVGAHAHGITNETLTEHWDGNTWSVVPNPFLPSSGDYFNGAAVTGANNAWAVGAFMYGEVPRTRIEHWDGRVWTIPVSPSPDYYSDLLAVTAVSVNDVWAVGYSGLSTSSPAGRTDPNFSTLSNTRLSLTSPNASVRLALVVHWSGTGWGFVFDPSPGRNFNELNDVAAVSSSDVWAVGDYNNGSVSQTLIERYNPCSPEPSVTPVACALQFEDVPNASTFYAYVHCMACRGIISGYPCGGRGEPCDPNGDPYFRPNGGVTRGQIAKIVALSDGISTAVSGQAFEDVPRGSTFYTYTEQLYALGVMNGYPCGSGGEPCIPPTNLPYFRPNSNATRGQLAQIDANTAGYTDPPHSQSFQDVPAGTTFYTYTQRLADRGILTGYPCGTDHEPCLPPLNRPYFRPNASVSRGQTSKIMANTFLPDCSP